MVTVLWFRSQMCLNTFTMLPLKWSFETGLFGNISNHVFRIAQFRKSISSGGHLFFETVQNLMYIFKVSENIEEKPFFFVIIASELVALNCLY